ncbi:MAG: ABC transporter substrate-binding protein [Candidatus Acidiferrales bacterium]
METILKGLTWDHPRGYSPLINAASEYEKLHPKIKIHWDRRTLREFGEAPIEQYLDRYDLIIMDHPFVGFAAAHNALVELGEYLTDIEQALFAADSVGPSWESYRYANGIWALPVDAATQVASYRPDLLEQLCATAPGTFEEVLQLGEKARASGKWIAVAACPIDAISLFFTLTANLGHPIAEKADPFVSESVAKAALDRLHTLIAVAHPGSTSWNPIQMYDHMITQSEVVYCPWAYGYSNYSRREMPIQLKFVDAPAAGSRGCAGTQLGGTGVAVSKQSQNRSEAVAYAKWLASPQHQGGAYFREGGQPASLAAWTDPQLDSEAGGFFFETLETLRTAYVRPRFDGFVRFFEAAGIEINRCLKNQLSDAQLIEWLNKHFRERLALAATRS